MQTYRVQVIKVTLGTAIFPVRYSVAPVAGRLDPEGPCTTPTPQLPNLLWPPPEPA